jgi:hypothetical protein
MSARSPSSQSALRLRWSLFDVVWAALAPYYALVIREAYILSYDGMQAALVFCLVSFVYSLLAFAVFRLRDGMARYFSVHDAGEIAKAVIMAELMTCTTLFMFTRLEGIPRSTPIVHALILGAGLVVARGLVRMSSTRFGEPRYRLERRHIVMIGVSRLTALYIKFLEAVAPGEHQVIAVLDDEPGTQGRSVNGVGIMGSTAELESVIEEFAVHGVRTDRVVVGCHAHEMPDQVLDRIRRVCEAHSVDLGFVPQLFGLTAGAETDEEPETQIRSQLEPRVPVPAYFAVKRYLDVVLALVLVAALAPLWAFAACLVLLDIGSPVFFWQQRVRLDGRSFLLYKFRTLRNPFDERGHKLAEAQRVSPIGGFLRRSRLDELPQLLNVASCGTTNPATENWFGRYRSVLASAAAFSHADERKAEPSGQGEQELAAGVIAMPSIERHSRESGHHLVAREPLRRRVRLTLQEEPGTDPGPGRVGIDEESSYVRGIDAGNQSRIVAVCNCITAEQGATKTPASTSHKSAGLLHDIVSAVLDDLPINSKKRTNRGASLFKGVFLAHQLHDRARDQGFDLRHVCKTCLSDLHRRSTRTKQSRLQQQVPQRQTVDVVHVPVPTRARERYSAVESKQTCG